jgi:hypothetical protein
MAGEETEGKDDWRQIQKKIDQEYERKLKEVSE